MLLLAAAVVLVVVAASAIAIGQLAPDEVDERPSEIGDERPSKNYLEVFRPIGRLADAARPQAIVAQPDGGALIVGQQDLVRFDPAAATLATVGRLRISRTLPSAVVLQDGRVLIVGGGLDISSAVPPDGYRAEIFDPDSGRSSLTGSTVEPRAWGTATLLQDGRVLIAGGASEGFAVGSAEIFDPGTGNFVQTGSMSRRRSDHAAVLLRDGRVLLVGGSGVDEPPSAELYDPSSGTFTPAAPMAVPQQTSFSITELADGRVLLAGGYDHHGTVLAAAQVYDPDSGEFTRTGSLPAPRHHHSSALLDDGRVLILGGWDEDAIRQGDDAFVYDPATGAFGATASLTVQRLAPFVTTLSDGRVLVVGSQCWNHGCYGLDATPSAAGREVSAEVFD